MFKLTKDGFVAATKLLGSRCTNSELTVVGRLKNDMINLPLIRNWLSA